MEYIRPEANGQLFLEPQTKEHLGIPSFLYGFRNEETTTETAQSGRTVFCFRGRLAVEEEDRVCKCGKRMHINAHPDIVLRHLCFGGNLSCVLFPHNQFKCPACGATKSQFISFKATGNRHLLWFRKLLDEHFEGIIAHATFQITSGKVEGINQKIKTLRRHGYGYPDDEYFFLKLLDASRRTYDRNPKSHRFCD